MFNLFIFTQLCVLQTQTTVRMEGHVTPTHWMSGAAVKSHTQVPRVQTEQVSTGTYICSIIYPLWTNLSIREAPKWLRADRICVRGGGCVKLSRQNWKRLFCSTFVICEYFLHILSSFQKLLGQIQLTIIENLIDFS
jgi:hypothetical protein